MLDIFKTQHYTTKSQEICANLLSYIPADSKLIEPFVGEGDLSSLFPDNDWITYDLDPKLENTIKQDTLLDPPDYSGRWVITNPPYLAKNKASDKSLFNKYGIDDLYKISLITMMESEGGIIIIPTNFFTDERTASIRNQFLSKFVVLEMNIYTEPIFDSTTYSVCAFAFKRLDNTSQTIPVNLFPGERRIDVDINQSTNFRFAGSYFEEINSISSRFTRLMKGREVPKNKYITNIKLYALDSRIDKIRLAYEDELFYGISTDRTYATFVSDIELTKEEQISIINGFNEELNSFRELYSDLVLTNYRDYNRKRIGFDFAYKLATKHLNKIKE